MPNDNNDSIRYLMKEMDPSEEVLMERSMMEDEDLLIEVESMRQTLKKLDDNLPTVDPPKHVTQKVLEKAAERKPKTSSNVIPIALGGKRMGYIAAAAVVAAGLISGVFLYSDVTGSAEQTQSQQQAASVSDMPAPTVNTEMETTPVKTSSIGSDKVNQKQIQPWVDHNEVLRFQDQFAEQNRASFDSALNVATQKLRELNDTFQSNPQSRTLQLTGSEQ